MKKISYMAYALHCMMNGSKFIKSNKEMIFADRLPMSAKMFIQKNFQGHSIAFVEKRFGMNGVEYDVRLNDGMVISFNESGAWNKIYSESGIILTDMMPKAMTFLLSKDKEIVMLAKKATGYEVMFSNASTMAFNRYTA